MASFLLRNILLITLPIFKRTFYVTLGRFCLQILALIIVMLAAGQRELQLRAAMLEVDLERHEGEALLACLAEQLDDLRLVHQELARAQRIVIEDIPLLIRADMHMLDENLAILDDSIAVLEIGLAGPQGFDLCPLQSQPCLKGLMDEKIMTCLAVLAGNLDGNVFLPQ